MENIDIDIIKDFVLEYGPVIIGAILALLIGLWIIRIFTKRSADSLIKRDIDPSLKPFIKSLSGTLLKTLLFISVLGMIGIEMTSFIAILGAAGLAVGLALSGTLQNFAGGVVILLLKPFKVGDFVDAAGYMGTVKGIQIFNTVLKTPDNKIIIIPNSALMNSSLTNFSAEDLRRVDWTFGIGYGDSYDKAKEVLLSLLNADERVHKDPAPFIALSELGDSSVNIVVRVWVNAPDYWAVFFDMNEKVYKTFDKEGLNIPFPQMDVHVKNKDIMRVSILKHIEFENPGYYLEYFSQRGFEALIHNLYEGEIPDDSSDVFLVLGGPMNIYEEEKYPFLLYEKKFLFEAIKKGKKVIGVCLGSQLLADVLGAKVYKNTHKEIGWFPIHTSQSIKDGSLPNNISVFHWHGDTFDLPEGAKVLYHSDATKIQGYEYGSNVLGMQFHLEVDKAGINELIQNCKDDLDDSLFVMSEKEIKNQWSSHSSSNKKFLWNILDNFLR